MWQPRSTSPVQGGQAVAAPPGQPNPVPPVSVPSQLSVLNANPLNAGLRDLTSSIEAQLQTVAFNTTTTSSYSVQLKNAALAYAVEAFISGTTKVTLGASTTAGDNGGGISLSPKFPFDLVSNVQFGINEIATVVNASAWLLFQEQLACMLPGLDPRQQKQQMTFTGNQGPAAAVPATYYVTPTVGGSSITLSPGGAPYYNTTTATEEVDIAWGFSLLIPFVNNFDEFLGLVPSASQDVQLAINYTFRSPLGSTANLPIQALSGADLTGTNATLTSHTGTISGEEYFLSSPPAGQESVYAVQAGTICQRFQQSITDIATGEDGAKYVAPQGAYLLRMIADLTLNNVPDTADVQTIKVVLNEFSRPLTTSLQSYLNRYYRKYGRLPDPGIFVWDGTYSSIVPNWGDSMDWINANVTIKPTFAFDISSSATIGTARLDVLRTQLVTPN